MNKATRGVSAILVAISIAAAAEAAPPVRSKVQLKPRNVVSQTVRVKAAQPQSMARRFAHLAPAVKVVNDPVNLQKLKAKATGGKRCGIIEVAPDNFVRMDCNSYTKPKKTVLHLSPAKANALKGRQFATSRSSNFLLKAKNPGAGKGGMVQSGGAPVQSGGAQVAEDFPDTVDHRALGLSGPIKSQGSVGACTAFALSTTVDNQLRRAGRDETTSPSHVWAGYGMPNMGDAADYNIGRPLATYDVWMYSQKEACRLARDAREECPFYVNVPLNSYRSDAALMSSLAKADSAAKIKISSIEELAGASNIDELNATLAGGNDIWAAMLIDGSKWSNSAMKNGVIPDWSQAAGGHAVTFAGYREASGGRQYLVHNSWGESWGDKGYAWISEKMVKKHLMYAYRVKLEGENAQPVEITDDDCAWDQLVDGVTGKCAKICPDDSRPQNGKCN